jgi:hypothetical protein
VLAWTLLALILLEVATFPWLDHLMRRAGRPDLALLARSRSRRPWRR